MIPPRSFPPGVLKLIQRNGDGTHTILQEFETSSKNRDRIHKIRNDLLIVSPTLDLVVTENNAKP
jgi:hypothetical protein